MAGGHLGTCSGLVTTLDGEKESLDDLTLTRLTTGRASGQKKKGLIQKFTQYNYLHLSGDDVI